MLALEGTAGLTAAHVSNTANNTALRWQGQDKRGGGVSSCTRPQRMVFCLAVRLLALNTSKSDCGAGVGKMAQLSLCVSKCIWPPCLPILRVPPVVPPAGAEDEQG
jgi:hypothetical protein